MDSDDWEKHLGGPDDDALEKFYENKSDETEPGDFEMEETDFEVFEEYHDSGSSRQKAIMAWLENSTLARRFKNSNGFFVPRGSHVHLMDNSIVDTPFSQDIADKPPDVTDSDGSSKLGEDDIPF
jgi:hypothetical protein